MDKCELANIKNEKLVYDIHKEYIEAGCNAIKTNTFGANLPEMDFDEELLKNVITKGWEIAEKAAENENVFVFADMGPIQTAGENVDKYFYIKTIDIFLSLGAENFLFETFSNSDYLSELAEYIKEKNPDAFIITSFAVQPDGYTRTGVFGYELLKELSKDENIDYVGINCVSGPRHMLEFIKNYKLNNLKISVMPNAGYPTVINNRTFFDSSPEYFAMETEDIAKLGVKILGGCCGTTPQHIQKLVSRLKEKKAREIPERKSIRALTTERNITPISLDGRFRIVGERINPTGKKELQEKLRAGDLSLVMDMAEEQEKLGASILDVNMGMNGIDEKEMMLRAVNELTMTVDLPLSIDSSYVDVVESALRIYPGRALINSISLEPEKFEKLIPIAKKYGAMFILLPLSDAGLPKDLDEKKTIIHTILDEAKRQGMAEEDIVVDGLVATIGANKNAALEVLETIRYCKNELGVATICGLSNISFGLPERVFVNTAFLTLAIGQGLTMAIANPSQTLLVNAALASDLLLNKEEADLHYINGVAGAVITQSQPKNEVAEEDGHPLYLAVVKGKSGHVLELVEEELKKGTEPSEIIDKYLIAAINYVGELFEQKKYFLPQLIASAETMEKAINRLEPLLEAARGNEKLATIVVATVKGDIHDIGKNLVALMLKNYGYHVIDLGKDVETQTILDTAKAENASIIGLSALMTTTMMEMKEVVDEAKKQGVKAKIIIGGAVVTESFAEEIGADGYSADAREAVKVVNRLLEK